MKAGEGSLSLPAWEGETIEHYLARLAVKQNYLEPGAAPALKPMPKVRREQSFLARLDEIWRKPEMGPAEPGLDQEPEEA